MKTTKMMKNEDIIKGQFQLLWISHAALDIKFLAFVCIGIYV